MELIDFFFVIGILVLVRALYIFYQWAISYIGGPINIKQEFHTDWAVITGANSGLGRALANRLADQGVNVIGTGRRLDALEAVKKEVEAKGAQFIPVQTDHHDPNSIKTLMDAVGDRDVGVCIINAGYGIYGPVSEAKDDDVASFISIMCTQYALLAREFIARNKNRPHKSVIYMTASLAADSLAPLGSLYCAVKAYVSRLSKHLAVEVAGTKIVVTAMHPGFFGSGFFDRLPPFIYKMVSGKLIFPDCQDVADGVMRTLGKSHRVDYTATSPLVRVMCWAAGEPVNYWVSRLLLKIIPRSDKKND